MLFLSLVSVNAQKTDRELFAYEYTKLGYRLDLFDQTLSDWQSGILEMKFKGQAWTLLPRLTLSNRFDQFGWMLEQDIYIEFKNEDYLYLDGAFSPDRIFPQGKLGVEYNNPFGTWEHAIGVRWMRFDQTGSVGLLTASLSKYYGSWLTSLRGVGAYGFETNQFANYAVILSHRYYLSDIEYAGLNASYGYDPSVIVLLDNSGSVKGNPSQLTLGVTYHSDYKNRLRWNASYEWTRYDFVSNERIQHTLRLFFTLKRKEP